MTSWQTKLEEALKKNVVQGGNAARLLREELAKEAGGGRRMMMLSLATELVANNSDARDREVYQRLKALIAVIKAELEEDYIGVADNGIGLTRICDTCLDSCVGVACDESWTKNCGLPLELIPKLLSAISNTADRLAAVAPPPSASVTPADADAADAADDDAAAAAAKDEEKDATAKKPASSRKKGGVKKEVAALREYKNEFIEKISEKRWPSQKTSGGAVVRVLEMLKECSLDFHMTELVLRKAMKEMESLELTQMFSMVHAMLQLASVGGCFRGAVMCGVVTHFDKLEAAASKNENKEEEESALVTSPQQMQQPQPSLQTLRDNEASVIFNMTISVNQDEILAKEFIKAIKARPAREPLLPFTLAVLLSIAKSPRLEHDVFSALKSVLTEALKYSDKRISPWIEAIASSSQGMVDDSVDGNNAADLQRKQVAECAVSSFMQVAKLTSSSWDFLTTSLLKFVLHLIESIAKSTTTTIPIAKSIPGRLFELCKCVLVTVFKLSVSAPVIRGLVIDSVCSRIVSQDDFSPLFVAVLDTLVQGNAREIQPFSGKIRSVLECLSRLPPDTVAGFLAALQPLMVLERSMLDVAIISLRKALFNKEAAGRESAVNGLCQLAKGSIVTTTTQQLDGPSQWSTTQRTKASETEMSMLTHEIFGLLRRALTQQMAVRKRLYSELSVLVEQAPVLCPQIYNLLYPHLMSYCEQDKEKQPPIRIKPCLSGMIVEEPLPQLIGCVGALALKLPDQDQALALQTTLLELVNRTNDTTSDAFDLAIPLDVAGDGGGDGPSVYKTQCLLLQNTFEAMIEAVINIDPTVSEASAELILGLFKKISHFGSLIPAAKKTNNKADKADEGNKKTKWNAGSSSSYTSIMSSRSVSLLLSSMAPYFESLSNKQQQAATPVDKSEPIACPLAENKEFRAFVIEACLDHFTRLTADTSTTNSNNNSVNREAWGLCQRVVPLLFKQLCTSSDADRLVKLTTTKAVKSGGTLAALTFETFQVGLEIVIQQCSLDGIAAFLTEAVPQHQDESSSSEEKIHYFITQFEEVLKNIKSKGALREAESLCKVITSLITLCPTRLLHTDRDFIQGLCKEPCKSLTLCKELTSMFVFLSGLIASQAELHLAMEVHKVLGNLDADEEYDHPIKYQIVSEESASIIACVLIESADKTLDELQWLLATHNHYNNKTAHVPVYLMVESLVAWVEHLIVRLPAKPAAVLIRMLKKFFTVLAMTIKDMSKAVTPKKTKKKPKKKKGSDDDDDGDDGNKLVLPKSLLLIEHSGTFTKHCYDFIEYVQSSSFGRGTGAEKETSTKVSRDLYNIPKLVFAIEKFEAEIVDLGKKIGQDFYGDYFKASAARDFVISSSQLEEEKKKGDEEEPPKKKKKKEKTSTSTSKKKEMKPHAAATDESMDGQRDDEEEEQEPDEEEGTKKKKEEPEKKKSVGKARTLASARRGHTGTKKTKK